MDSDLLWSQQVALVVSGAALAAAAAIAAAPFAATVTTQLGAFYILHPVAVNVAARMALGGGMAVANGATDPVQIGLSAAAGGAAG